MADGSAPRGSAGSTGPPTRSERQRRTREALIEAARVGFARDGYNGASLEQIAREAGFTKGAVYSNFESKALLFLAVLDANLAAVGQKVWDPYGAPPEAPALTPDEEAELAQLQDVIQGFALASLEFIAAAGRDPALRAELAKRMGAMVGLYTDVAAGARDDDDPLTAEELGVLLAALDQGGALVMLSGRALDRSLLAAGMRRVIEAGRDGRGQGPDRGVGAVPQQGEELWDRIADSVRARYQSGEIG